MGVAKMLATLATPGNARALGECLRGRSAVDPNDTNHPLLHELLNASIILPEEWDDLSDETRRELAGCANKEDLLAVLSDANFSLPIKPTAFERGFSIA